MKLEELRVYVLAMEIGEEVWGIVAKWDYFQKDTVGKQLVKAADSIAANISEGYGRYHFKDSRKFGYYSRGSLHETKTWIIKAQHRNLIAKSQSEKLVAELDQLGRMLNTYIKSIGTVSEPGADYNHSTTDDDQ